MKPSLRIVYSLIVFILGIVLLSVLAVLLIYENSQTKVTSDLVNHTNVVRHSLEKVFSTLKDAGSAHREYLLTNDSSSLKHYRAVQSLQEQFENLDSLVAGDAIQKQNTDRLKKLFQNRLRRLGSLLKKHENPAYRKSTEFYKDMKADQATMDSARQLLNHMQHIEQELLEKRQGYADRHSALPTVIGIGLSIFSIIIFILAFYFTNLELRKTHHLNDELESKNLQLEKYTWELSAFTHITSHDMQEPLRKIELFISMIEAQEKGNLSANALKHFEKIKESVSRMRQLFFSILNFSLTDNRKNNIEEVDLNTVLWETLESLDVSIRDTQALIRSSPLPIVKGVRYQMIQLFENIISNALKYKRNEVTPEVIISYEILEGKAAGVRDLKKEKKYYRINFKDNGIGFDQKYGDKIFEIFQRLHSRSHGDGVGIGLSICRKIAQNHHGTLTAKGDINKGSLFSFYIPVDQP